MSVAKEKQLYQIIERPILQDTTFHDSQSRFLLLHTWAVTWDVQHECIINTSHCKYTTILPFFAEEVFRTLHPVTCQIDSLVWPGGCKHELLRMDCPFIESFFKYPRSNCQHPGYTAGYQITHW
jgi:hypothetical protein